MGHAERLAPGGLVFLGMMSLECPLIPPTLANLAQGYPPTSGKWPRSVVDSDTPDFVARANEGWLDLSREGGLFGDDLEFLVAVEIEVDEEVTDWWWARVKLAESWDIMGAGSAAALGVGFGVPEFAMLSLAGDVIVCGTAGESAIGTVRVSGFRDLAGLRKLADWIADWPTTRQQEKAAARRWLESIGY
ncbi:hypothetical protein [Polymorphospora rubra]|uniref:Uncharacterized protein n=1 Tax=Polymorphospora rubra TaxID=338584 RepID=A0A810N627_9ACTN|nr:hypothetical protein [Polymorphospora rubra]BCJ68420.1 hypothetical protein Prubr_54410 [Polymorphospora rubra]